MKICRRAVIANIVVLGNVSVFRGWAEWLDPLFVNLLDNLFITQVVIGMCTHGSLFMATNSHLI